jgi:hypothetical protein
MTLVMLTAIAGLAGLTLVSVVLHAWFRRRRLVWASSAQEELINDALPDALRTLERHEQTLRAQEAPARPTPDPLYEPTMRETVRMRLDIRRPPTSWSTDRAAWSAMDADSRTR